MKKRDFHEISSDPVPEDTKPCRVCVGFGHCYEMTLSNKPAGRNTKQLWESSPREEKKDCKACKGTGRQPVPVILSTNDRKEAHRIMETKPKGYNEHLWLVKTNKEDGLISSIVSYGMHTSCDIFFAGEEWFNSEKLFGERAETCEEESIEEFLHKGYRAVHWLNAAGERQDLWFRKGTIYYCKLA